MGGWVLRDISGNEKEFKVFEICLGISDLLWTGSYMTEDIFGCLEKGRHDAGSKEEIPDRRKAARRV